MEKTLERLNKLALFFIIYSIVVITFFKSLSYILPFVLAILFALALQTPTKYLISKFKIKESVASLITTFVFFTIIIVLLFLMVTLLATEITQLTKTISVYIASKSEDINIFADKLQQYYNGLDPAILISIRTSMASSLSTITKTTANLGVIIVSALMHLVSSVPYVLMVIVFTLIGTYFFTKDIAISNNKILNKVLSHDTDRATYIYSEIKRMLLGYLKSYMILVLITFLFTFIGFSAVGVNYALVLSILSAFFDLLPVLGMPIIYFPVAALYFINGEVVKGVVIIALYGLAFVGRQIIEPKVLSSSLGLHPVSVLAAIFIGLKINGVSGMFFCMFLVVFYNILKKVNVL